MPTLPSLQLHCYGIVEITTDAGLHIRCQVLKIGFVTHQAAEYKKEKKPVLLCC